MQPIHTPSAPDTPAVDSRRFALLWHVPEGNEPPPHWDLMLQNAGVLWSWRLPSWPQSGGDVTAERTPDHRLRYLDYSGPLGRGKGFVERRDGGRLVVESWNEREIRGRIYGEQNQAHLHLVRCDSYNCWSLAIRPNLASESDSSS